MASTVPTDLFRCGNATSPKLANVRPKDVHLDGNNVVADGSGISTFNKEGIKSMYGQIWSIQQGTAIPKDLKVVKDNARHYSIAPIQDMPIEHYKKILNEWGENWKYEGKKTKT